MHRDTQIRLIRRALTNARERRYDMAERSAVVPASYFTSRDRFEREVSVLFRRFPIVVGFSSQVARPGDFLTHELTGVPILVVRDLEGRLDAFINVCRHRGAHLTREPCGKGKKAFACPFHGWTYDLKGRLTGVPHEGGFPELDRERSGLSALPVAERYGLVFVVPTPGAELDIDRYLGSLIKDWDSFGFADYMMIRPAAHRRRFNWKLHMDATQEIYHLGSLHRDTAGSGFFNNLSLLDWEKPHARIVMPGNAILELEGSDPLEWSIRDHAGIVYGIFPNTTALVHEGVVQVLSTFPVDVDTAILSGGMLVPKGPVSDELAFRRKTHYETYWKTMEEDMSICESMQANMSTGLVEELKIGRFEYILAEYHAAIDEVLE